MAPIKAISGVIFSIVVLAYSTATANETWNGLVIAKEHRCSPYNKKAQYPYPQSVEDKIIAAMGGKIYGPYTGRYFDSKSDTDIEHIVAASEGHDSGLCQATAAERKEFATDLLNLTLATPRVNRCSSLGKCGKDAYEWLPPKNKCWFAQRNVDIRKKYSLTIDRREADLLEAVLSHCPSTEMKFTP
jgi:hypothetical protein